MNNYARRQWRVDGRYERDQNHKSQNDAIGSASKSSHYGNRAEAHASRRRCGRACYRRRIVCCDRAH
jgi:hypothetical protein